ncbi:PD40 domain-containing protein, partial [Candidatus Poribacteria bacterium]|nr:PD40 domain-containing protein [Candidatus Poribacteria bacterium]
MLRKDIILRFLGSFIFGALVCLSISPALAQAPMITFLSDRSGEDEIYILFDDGKVEQLTKNKARTLDPDWSPNGRTIAFASNIRGGEAFDIYTIEVSSKKLTDLTSGMFGGNWQKPRWAPKGDPRIVAESPNVPNANNWDVGVIVDATKKPVEILNVTNATAAAQGADVEASWSPDGTKLAFQSERVGFPNGKADIFIADMDAKKPGAKQQNITNHLATDRRARWSPDGTKILFESDRDGDLEIYVIDIEGKNPRQLTNNDKTDVNAEWSTTGIVFESNRDGNSEIYRMDADGNNQINLTKDPGRDTDPIWSPNGQKILFESRRDGDRELYVMDADGSNVKNLTNNPAKDFFGKWNPVSFLLAVEPQQKQLTTFGEIKRTSLMQNYPNPFNPDTWIPYHLADESAVTVRIYNITGELVRWFEIGKQPAGA